MLKLTFGKYGPNSPGGGKKGKAVEQVFFIDPDYLWWISKQDGFFFGTNAYLFEKLCRRAAHLVVPGECHYQGCHKPISRMLMIKHISGGLGAVEFVCDTCNYAGGSPSRIMTPGLHAPPFKRYDKTGCRYIVEAVKKAFFGDRKHRMTAARANHFFDTPANFVNF